jgi:uncharacterized protein
MEVSFDPTKNDRNIALRGLSFERAADFDFLGAVVLVDDRREYGETRLRAFGLLNNRLHALVFTETACGIRVISLRKANQREVKRYGR